MTLIIRKLETSCHFFDAKYALFVMNWENYPFKVKLFYINCASSHTWNQVKNSNSHMEPQGLAA
jgi:hypothetical protein